MAVTASGYFCENLVILYRLALDQVRGGKVFRHGINWYTDHAPPAYVMAVAAIESFFNEIALSDFARFHTRDSPLWECGDEWIHRLDLAVKLVMVPQILYGKTFDRGAAPFQDLSLLLKIRNDFVHYKMSSNAPKYVEELERKRLRFRARRAAQPSCGRTRCVRRKASDGQRIQWQALPTRS